jgi:hypothetical protein
VAVIFLFGFSLSTPNQRRLLALTPIKPVSDSLLSSIWSLGKFCFVKISSSTFSCTVFFCNVFVLKKFKLSACSFVPLALFSLHRKIYKVLYLGKIPKKRKSKIFLSLPVYFDITVFSCPAFCKLG